MSSERNPIRSNIYHPSISQAKILNDYFEWLCGIVDVNMEDRTYWFLTKTLQNKDFYWSVPNDDNRGADGLKLRDEFGQESQWFTTAAWHLLVDRPCTVLEMLIGLARRMSDITAELGNEDHTRDWFWVLIRNLDLEKFTDEDYFDFGGTPRIMFLLDQVLGRTFKRSGKGGLFPLRNAKKDQRKVEIWYQMCSYLMENYFVDGQIK